MKQSNSSSASGGIGCSGFLGLLALLFIALKLTGHIGWSWVWVLAPLWGQCVLGIVVIGILILLAFVVKK